jgi:hypothetical protein
VRWPSTYDEESTSVAQPTVEELLFVEQNVRHALALGLEETNNWAPDAQRTQFVYNAWDSQGRPSAKAIGKAPHRPPTPQPAPSNTASPHPLSPGAITPRNTTTPPITQSPPPTPPAAIRSVNTDLTGHAGVRCSALNFRRE